MFFSRRRKNKTTEAAPVVHYPPVGSEIHNSPPLPPPPPYSSLFSQSVYQIPLGTPPPPPRRPPGVPDLPPVAVPAPLRPRRPNPQSVAPVYQLPVVYEQSVAPVYQPPVVYEQPAVSTVYQQPAVCQQRPWNSCLDLPTASVPGGLVPIQTAPTVDPTARHSTVSVHDQIADKFGHVISLIDEDAFGGESELLITLPGPGDAVPNQPLMRGGGGGGGVGRISNNDGVLDRSLRPSRSRPRVAGKQTNVFSKLDSYLNSRLPNSLPPLRVYLPTYPLLCLAAKYSASAYQSPSSAVERKDFVSANPHTRAKAMVIKSVAIDDKKTIVFAIRGTSMLSLHDWGINLSTQPVSPAGFLDDAGNLCHSGFLKVAKAMVGPIAARLRQLLQEDPSRSSCSLLLTGHSAGGAVAALLYSHMLASNVSSELNTLTGCFKRVHCVTFGAPPVTLLPLQRPETAKARLRKCIFFSIMNEGDPVVRAEKAYVGSLIELLACPDPHRTDQCHKCSSYLASGNGSGRLPPPPPPPLPQASTSRLDLSLKANKPLTKKHTHSCPHHNGSGKHKLWWDVPTATLSNAGRLIVLRVSRGGASNSSSNRSKKKKTTAGATAAVVEEAQGYPAAVTACIVTDEQLRKVIFGDPLMHSMDLYLERVEALAVRAVTGRLLDQ